MATVLEKQMAQAPTQTMTFGPFLAVVDEDDYAEWVNGAVVFKGTESAAHQDLAGFLMCLLKWHTEDHDAGEVLCNPFLMKLSQSARAPDLLFIMEENLSRLTEYYLDGPADLVIEIVSPESVLRDRGAKYAEYEAGGVREYWSIDAEAKRADFFVLDGEGRYQRASPDDGGKYQSAVLPGFWISLTWLWQSPLPPVRSVLREWEQESPSRPIMGEHDKNRADHPTPVPPLLGARGTRMNLQTNEPRNAYLEVSALIDHAHPSIGAWAAAHEIVERSDVDIAREAFEFVRDSIAHSWDIQSCRVTARASEVLEHGEGICYAKSHLLAALLRRQGIPAGVCYQRLTLGDTPDTGYCIHALNTVFLPSLGRWIRLDARGNKPGVDAQFSLDTEQLAYAVRPEMGECDYGINHAEPHPVIAATLRAHSDCRAMYAHHLPTEL